MTRLRTLAALALLSCSPQTEESTAQECIEACSVLDDCGLGGGAGGFNNCNSRCTRSKDERDTFFACTDAPDLCGQSAEGATSCASVAVCLSRAYSPEALHELFVDAVGRPADAATLGPAAPECSLTTCPWSAEEGPDDDAPDAVLCRPSGGADMQALIAEYCTGLGIAEVWYTHDGVGAQHDVASERLGCVEGLSAGVRFVARPGISELSLSASGRLPDEVDVDDSLRDYCWTLGSAVFAVEIDQAEAAVPLSPVDTIAEAPQLVPLCQGS